MPPPKQPQPPQPPPPEEPPREVIVDAFQRFKKDPRLNTFAQKEQTLKSTATTNTLHQLLNIPNEEQFLNELRLYKKREEQKIINTLEGDPLKNRQEILRRLSTVADTLIMTCTAYFSNQLTTIHGLPSFLSSYKQNQPTSLAILCSGDLGAEELNYNSPIDLSFVYSNRGETFGRDKKSIDNNEFYTTLFQKVAKTLSAKNPERAIMSYDHFIDHHMNHANDLERVALVSTRVLADDSEFRTRLEQQIEQLAYDRPLPLGFAKEMTLNHESELTNVTKVLRFIQLSHGTIFKDLRKRSLFDVLNILKGHALFKQNELELMIAAHALDGTIASLLYLITGKAGGILDVESDTCTEIARRLRLRDKNEFKEKLLETRKVVYNILISHV